MSINELRKTIRFCLTPIASAIFLMQMSGCMTLPSPMMVPDTSTAALKAPSGMDSDFVDIEAGFESGDMFMLKPMDSVGTLPHKMVPSFSLNEVGIFDTMRMLIADTGLTLNIEGGTRGSEAYGAVSMYNVHGKLKDVVDDLSESMGFFYSVRKNTLHIQPEQQFVVQLPPALSDDNMAGLTNTLQFLGAKEVYIDRLSRSLVFRSNKPSLAKIEQYLTSIRESRSMIIYAMNIFQVDLKHNSDTGIQWNKVGWTSAPGSSIAAGPGSSGSVNGTGLGLGMVLSGSNFSVDMLVNFLKTQGAVKAISQPRLGVINGTKGTLSVGQTLTYVSKVGTTYATSLNQITTETKDLKTGVDIVVYGDVSDNTVYTHLDLKISDVVKINKYTALGTDLTLPQTVNRDLNTVVRARPGDMILVGGITIDRDVRENNSGVSKNGVSTEVSRSEMVLALRTKVINFLPKKKVALPAAVEAPVNPQPIAAVSSNTPPSQAAAPSVTAKISPATSAPVPAPVSVPVPAQTPSPLPMGPVAPALTPASDRVQDKAVKSASAKPHSSDSSVVASKASNQKAMPAAVASTAVADEPVKKIAVTASPAERSVNPIASTNKQRKPSVKKTPTKSAPVIAEPVAATQDTGPTTRPAPGPMLPLFVKPAVKPDGKEKAGEKTVVPAQLPALAEPKKEIK